MTNPQLMMLPHPSGGNCSERNTFGHMRSKQYVEQRLRRTAGVRGHGRGRGRGRDHGRRDHAQVIDAAVERNGGRDRGLMELGRLDLFYAHDDISVFKFNLANAIRTLMIIHA
ncbi:hypothetical protein EVAR_81939_1 [Eumeta japonica]|uniref:Uncharacterized protein n=1 Tax=Eumeta variegata TaxID=151549 RepID=A0A4C1ZI98_EUMVA|nr:hypothetical protein EVAR_81939_1 [Eumeta japonica]